MHVVADALVVDGPLAQLFNMVVAILISAMSRLVAIAFSAPVFIVPGLVIGICGGVLGQVYMKAQMSVKRERSNAKSPVVAEVNGAFAGLVSIRAFGVQKMFTQQGVDKINKYTQLSILFYFLNRWISVRIQVWRPTAASNNCLMHPAL
jgi:H+/Cl- antiporter ClcA